VDQDLVTIPREDYEALLEDLEALSHTEFLEGLRRQVEQALKDFRDGNLRTFDEFVDEMGLQ